jgi:hypothetical protein
LRETYLYGYVDVLFGEMLSWVLKERWFWLLFAAYLILFTVPLLVAWVIFSLTPAFMVVALIALIVVWIVVKSYRDSASRGEEGEAHGDG